jgi:hypothetical protein
LHEKVRTQAKLISEVEKYFQEEFIEKEIEDLSAGDLSSDPFVEEEDYFLCMQLKYRVKYQKMEKYYAFNGSFKYV